MPRTCPEAPQCSDRRSFSFITHDQRRTTIESLQLTLAGHSVLLRGPEQPLRRALGLLDPFDPTTEGESSAERLLRVSRNDSKIYLDDGDERVIGARTGEDFLLLLMNYLTQVYLDFLPEKTVALHSAGLRNDESVLLITGDPDSGKSTAVTTLLQPDYGYLSDEIVGINPHTGTVYPFPRLIELDGDHTPGYVEPSLRLKNSEGKTFAFVRPLESCVETDPLAIESLSVVLLKRNGNNGLFTAPSPGQQLSHLDAQSVLPADNDRRFRELSELVRSTDPFRILEYGDIRSVNDRLHGFLRSDS